MENTVIYYKVFLNNSIMKYVLSFLLLMLYVSCNTNRAPKELSTQERIALIDSILSDNNMSVTMESIELNSSFDMIFTADRIITSKDSLKFFMIRGKEGGDFKGSAIILPSEINSLCSKIDSVLRIVSKPIAYNKAFSISNNAGLSISAKTNEAKDWELFVNLTMQGRFSCKVHPEYIEYIAETLNACVDSNGEMKSSEVIVEEEAYYHRNDKEFFDRVDNIVGVTKTKSGVRYEVLKNTDGAKPQLDDVVTINYIMLASDSVIDKNVMTARVNMLVLGLQEGLQLQTVGSKYKFYLPSHLAYGYRQFNDIPPFTPLVGEVELLDIK